MSKVALVTGGTRGIGGAISSHLAESGFEVLAMYNRDRASAEALSQLAEVRKWKLRCLRGDLTNPEKFESVIEEIKSKFSQIDVLIHSAASGVHRPASELTSKHIKWTLDINVSAVHNLTTQLLEMIPSGGRIIGITSTGGTRTIPFYAAVGASKGAMESLFRHYAVEFAPRGIAVNCVCPGLVLTKAVEAFPERDLRIQKTIEATPSGRLTTPEDVAQVVGFLCGPLASQIIGQTIVVDGGKSLMG